MISRLLHLLENPLAKEDLMEVFKGVKSQTKQEIERNNQLFLKFESLNREINGKIEWIKANRLQILERVNLSEQEHFRINSNPDYNPRFKILTSQLEERQNLEKELINKKSINCGFMKEPHFSKFLELKIMLEELQNDLSSKKKVEVSSKIKLIADQSGSSSSSSSSVNVSGSLKEVSQELSLKNNGQGVFNDFQQINRLSFKKNKQNLEADFNLISGLSNYTNKLQISKYKSGYNFPVLISSNSSLGNNDLKENMLICQNLKVRQTNNKFRENQISFLQKHIKLNLLRQKQLLKEEYLTILSDEIGTLEKERNSMESQLRIQSEVIKSQKDRIRSLDEFAQFFQKALVDNKIDCLFEKLKRNIGYAH